MCLLAAASCSEIEIIIEEDSIATGQLLILYINVKYRTSNVFSLCLEIWIGSVFCIT